MSERELLVTGAARSGTTALRRMIDLSSDERSFCIDHFKDIDRLRI